MEIIVNELPLTEAFIPTRLLHREGQLRELERCLKPLLDGRLASNVFLVGSTGTGKSLLAKWILETYFQGMHAYVNCWKYKSTHEVFKEILLSLHAIVHGREPTSELIKKLEKLLSHRRAVICLDEVDQLESFDVLYYLAGNRNCALVLVSNDYHALMDLDSRIKSRLALTEIEFPKYTREELYDILSDRVQYAFKPGTISKGLVMPASALASGDARIGLEILRRAGVKAEDKGLSKVTVNEIREAAREARKLKKSYLLSKLNEHQRIIYEILEKRRSMFSGQLYRLYCSRAKKPVCSRAYRNMMRKMVKLGIISGEGYGKWRKYLISL